ncbi:MAG: GAF domain-containing protein [Acidobacteria bacterium]|nr:GAF domain-containing protein [Acidobacteriota bacterium]
MAEGLSARVSHIVNKVLKSGKHLEPADCAQIASAIAESYKVTAGEVALLELAPDGKQLNFLIPDKLARVGNIPMSSTSALAVRTVREGRAEMVNNFSAVRHASVFEGVSVSDKGAVPIQKILSVPIMLEGKARGVIQVSRKGKTPGAAGENFTTKDLEELVRTAAALSQCFKQE